MSLKVSGRWLRIKLIQYVRSFYGDEAANSFKGSTNWLLRFVNRCGIALRQKTNKKKVGNSGKLQVIEDFHRQLRKDLNSAGRRESFFDFHPTWGHWLPSRKYNVDQVLCHFIINQDSTYEEKGSSSMWTAQPVSGLDKRQCTLQLCIHTEEPQNIPPAVIFRGKGNIPPSEKAAYDKRVHVYWQTNAWLESELALEWVKNTFAPTLSKDAENVLFLDNLRCQTSEVFHSVCNEAA